MLYVAFNVLEAVRDTHHMFSSHLKADQMFAPDLGFNLASTFDINDIML